jgi:DnaK suppressor protein
MTQAFIKEMENVLRQEETRLRAELAEFAAQDPKNRENYMASTSSSDDETDAAAEATTLEDTRVLEESLEGQLRDVESALERMEKGTYGICKYCAKPIDEKRLRARPESSSCIECKKSLTQEM